MELIAKIDSNDSNDSIDEAIAALQAVREKRNAIDENGDVNGDPEPITSVSQVEPEMQEEITQDAHDAQEGGEYFQMSFAEEEPSGDKSASSETKEEIRASLREIGIDVSDSSSPSPHRIGCEAELCNWYPVVGKRIFKMTISSIQKAFPYEEKGRQWNWQIVRDFFTFVYLYTSHGFKIDGGRLAKVSRGITSNRYYPASWYLSNITSTYGEFAWIRYNKFMKKNKLPDIF